MAKVRSTVTVVDGKVRLNHGDDSYTEYLTVPDSLTLTFRD